MSHSDGRDESCLYKGSMTTIRDALQQSMQQLLAANPSEEHSIARLDAQVLLAHVLDIERAMLYAYPERELTLEQEQQFFALLARRAQGEPVAYLLGHKEFYGLDFIVDSRVLIPRPETELLVETALQQIRLRLDTGQMPVVVDIGTGSGAIPITLAVEEPRLPYLYASDISANALAVARLNCQHHHVEARVRLLQGDLLASLPEAVDVLLANLPYVGTDERDQLTPDVVNYEPHLALFSGPKGLALLYRLLDEIRQSATLKSNAVILLEIGYQQREPLQHYLHEHWPQAEVIALVDYAGWDRVLQIQV